MWRSPCGVTRRTPDATKHRSSAFDAHVRDPLAQLRLHEVDFAWITRAILAAAPGVPVVSMLEGGYDLQALGSCVAVHLQALETA